MSPSFLSYLNPLAAAAAAATSSSPSPSPNTAVATSLSQQPFGPGASSLLPPGLMSSAGSQSAATAAALSALMDPLNPLSKSAQAQLMAAAAAQQNFMLQNEMKSESIDNNGNNSSH
jgi:hypothetical protein